MRCIEVMGSDNRMDCRNHFHDPLNSLPPKCIDCGFPDLNHVPEPYYLVKSRTMSPNEMASAENGNFFVRDRIRNVLELLVPDDLDFHATCYKGTSTLTPWHLAVPNHQVVAAEVNPSIPRCSSCDEPRSAHPGSQYSKWLWNRDSDYEVVKSSTWHSSEKSWKEWIGRSVFMSVRLFSLLKKIKAKGLNECTCGRTTSPCQDETEWVKRQLDLLRDHGVPLHAFGTISDDDAKWFRRFLKAHAVEPASSIDWKSIEKSIRFRPPKSYKDFIGKIGPRSFEDVDEQDGFTAHVIPPTELDCTSYRAGNLEVADGKTNSVDGVMFARTDHGDCFCFDVRSDRKELEVFLYLHEYGSFEPYAPDFAACIKRFAAVANDA